MPFVKGMPKPPKSGRRHGSISKLSREVYSRLESLGVDPIEGMARIAEDRKQDMALRGKMYAELAQYCYPKRRSVEHSGPGGDPIEINALTGKQALEARIAGIRQRLGIADRA